MTNQPLSAERFYAALMNAGALKEYQPMTPARFHQIFNSQTITAKKVYEAVPKEEAWPINRIHSAMVRKGQGGGRDMRVTTGCLQSLKESRLITEPQNGEFMRVEVRPKPVIHIEELDLAPEPQPQQPEIETMPTIKDEMNKLHLQKPTPLDRLSALSKRANEIMHMVHQLANDIDAAAIAIEDERTTESADTAKLKQLKALLGSI